MYLQVLHRSESSEGVFHPNSEDVVELRRMDVCLFASAVVMRESSLKLVNVRFAPSVERVLLYRRVHRHSFSYRCLVSFLMMIIRIIAADVVVNLGTLEATWGRNTLFSQERYGFRPRWSESWGRMRGGRWRRGPSRVHERLSSSSRVEGCRLKGPGRGRGGG